MNDRLDDFLSLAETPDWISPSLAILQDIINGPSNRIYINQDCGYSCNQIKRTIRQSGFKVWGDCIIDNMIVMSVEAKYYDTIVNLLMVNGVVVL